MTGAANTVVPELSLASWEDADRLFQARREAMVSVRQPLVLITQVQRSGGTLVSSLMDGHPELHVHPWEITIGKPKYEWPEVDLSATADEWLEALRQKWVHRVFATGYVKDRARVEFVDGAPPSLLVPSFLDRLFRILVAEQPPETPREVLDHYFTALFNAWVDCQGLWDEPKRWLAGFCPRVGWGESRARWRRDYPDGRLVCVLRDPRGWYLSAANHPFDTFSADRDLLEVWETGAREIAHAKRDLGDDAFVMGFEGLVADPAAAMRALADWLGIAWDPVLASPTFNRRPVLPNSSFDRTQPGVRAEAGDRWRSTLEPGERAMIEERVLPLYEEVRSIADFA
jgi:sulfotransferase family protein